MSSTDHVHVSQKLSQCDGVLRGAVATFRQQCTSSAPLRTRHCAHAPCTRGGKRLGKSKLQPWRPAASRVSYSRQSTAVPRITSRRSVVAPSWAFGLPRSPTVVGGVKGGESRTRVSTTIVELLASHALTWCTENALAAVSYTTRSRPSLPGLGRQWIYTSASPLSAFQHDTAGSILSDRSQRCIEPTSPLNAVHTTE